MATRHPGWPEKLAQVCHAADDEWYAFAEQRRQALASELDGLSDEQRTEVLKEFWVGMVGDVDRDLDIWRQRVERTGVRIEMALQPDAERDLLRWAPGVLDHTAADEYRDDPRFSTADGVEQLEMLKEWLPMCEELRDLCERRARYAFRMARQDGALPGWFR